MEVAVEELMDEQAPTSAVYTEHTQSNLRGYLFLLVFGLVMSPTMRWEKNSIGRRSTFHM